MNTGNACVHARSDTTQVFYFAPQTPGAHSVGLAYAPWGAVARSGDLSCCAALAHHECCRVLQADRQISQGCDRGLAGRPAEPAWRVNAD